jgi:hypothetical protein
MFESGENAACVIERTDNASITRTGLLSSMKSLRHSGKSVHCPRSASSMKRLIDPPAEARENHSTRASSP